MKKITILSILVIIAFVGQSMAQPGNGRGRGPAGPGGPAFGGRMQMFNNLDLTEDQKAQIAELRKGMAERMEAADSPEAKREIMEAMRDRFHAVLTDEQKEKVEQMRGRAGDRPGRGAPQRDTAPVERPERPLNPDKDKAPQAGQCPLGLQGPGMGMARGFAGPGRGGFGQGMAPGRGRGMQQGRGMGMQGPGRGRGMMQGRGMGMQPGMCPGCGACMMQQRGRGFGQGMGPGRGRGMMQSRAGRGMGGPGMGMKPAGGMGMMPGGPMAGNMMMERIANHLELTEDQKAQIKEIHHDSMVKSIEVIKKEVLNDEQAQKLDKVMEKIHQQMTAPKDKPEAAPGMQRGRGQGNPGQGRPGGARRGR